MQLPQGTNENFAVVPLEGAGSSFLFLLGESLCHGLIHPQIVAFLPFFGHTPTSPRNEFRCVGARMKQTKSPGRGSSQGPGLMSGNRTNIYQRCAFLRDARSTEMRREQRCEENRDAKRPDREIKRERERESAESERREGSHTSWCQVRYSKGIRCQAVLESFLQRCSRSDSAPGVDV